MNIRKMTLISIACAGLAALVATAAARADEVKAGDLVISQAWSRATPSGAGRFAYAGILHGGMGIQRV